MDDEPRKEWTSAEIEEAFKELVERELGARVAVAAVIDHLARQGVIGRAAMTEHLRTVAAVLDNRRATKVVHWIADRADGLGNPTDHQGSHLRLVEKDEPPPDR